MLSPGSAAFLLEATGVPLGSFAGAQYERRTHVIPLGGTLLLFADGLTDSIATGNPDESLRDALAGTAAGTMSKLKSLVDPKLKEDDVTMLLVKRM